MTNVPPRRPLLVLLTLLVAFSVPVSTWAGAPLETLTLPGPGGNGGMYIPDVQVSYPGVDWQTLDRLYIPADHYRYINLGNLPHRTAGRPLVITNTGGQVRVGGLDFHYNFIISGGSHWILTGEWNADTATGHIDFPGHAGGAYANSRDRYGILIDDAFEDSGNSGLGVGGGATEFELAFLEIRHVGFAGILMKTDDVGDAHMENVRFHDCYIHDTGSEGIYFGSTQSQPQHRISGLQFYNNRIIRTGTEALQIGQVGGDSEIHHNVILAGAIDWKDPFQAFQDNNSQLASRNGGLWVHHNVFIGGASKFLISFNQNESGDTPMPGDLVRFNDNYFSHSRQFGVYVHSSADGVTRFRFDSNFFRAIEFHYDELDPSAVDYNRVFRIFNTANPWELVDNRWDGPQLFAAVAGSNVVEQGNVNETVPPIAFHDAGFTADFDYFRLEMWTATSGIQADAPVFYEEGDYVMHEGLLYRCIEPGSHTNKVPPANPATWQLQPLPADDVRLAPGSPYPGVGLLDAVFLFSDGFESGDLSAWDGGV